MIMGPVESQENRRKTGRAPEARMEPARETGGERNFQNAGYERL